MRQTYSKQNARIPLARIMHAVSTMILAYGGPIQLQRLVQRPGIRRPKRHSPNLQSLHTLQPHLSGRPRLLAGNFTLISGMIPRLRLRIIFRFTYCFSNWLTRTGRLPPGDAFFLAPLRSGGCGVRSVIESMMASIWISSSRPSAEAAQGTHVRQHPQDLLQGPIFRICSAGRSPA